MKRTLESIGVGIGVIISVILALTIISPVLAGAVWLTRIILRSAGILSW